MKIIIRLDTDDQEKIYRFSEELKEETILIPQGDHVKVHVIDNDGKVTFI